MPLTLQAHVILDVLRRRHTQGEQVGFTHDSGETVEMLGYENAPTPGALLSWLLEQEARERLQRLNETATDPEFATAFEAERRELAEALLTPRDPRPPHLNPHPQAAERHERDVAELMSMGTTAGHEYEWRTGLRRILFHRAGHRGREFGHQHRFEEAYRTMPIVGQPEREAMTFVLTVSEALWNSTSSGQIPQRSELSERDYLLLQFAQGIHAGEFPPDFRLDALLAEPGFDAVEVPAQALYIRRDGVTPPKNWSQQGHAK